MDLTNINKTTTIITKNPDTETESPPPQTHPTTKSFSFTNGSFYHLHLHHSHHPLPLQMVVSYKECLKNHAASIGGHALDGCGEFMPSPTATSTDPTSLKCAACGCHRNFHRRDSYDPNSSPPSLALQPPPAPPSSAAAALNPSSPSPSTDPSSAHSPDANSPQPPAVTSPAPCSYYSSAPHMLLALSSGYAAAAKDHYPYHHASFHQVATKRESHPSAKKRSRTKFSREQKDKMQAFAEKLGWRMNKAEERLTEEFCRQVGVSRRVFKVWMHNNKQALGKKLGLDNISAAHMVNSKNDGVNGYTINGDNNNQNEAGSVHPVIVSPKSED